MTREDEIIQVAKIKEKEIGFSDIIKETKGINSAYGIGFIEGAEWADENLRSGLVSMEFACKYWETILTSWGVDRHNILLALGNFSHAVNLENKK